jgi:hypothetical protein
MEHENSLACLLEVAAFTCLESGESTPRPPSLLIKGKVVPLHSWSGPEGSRKLRFPDYMTTAQDGGKVVSQPYAPAAFTPGNAPGTHFC